MQKSSKIVIFFSVWLLLGTVWLFFMQSESTTGPLTENQMQFLIGQFRNALQQKDVDTIISRISPSANIVGLKRDELRSALTKTVQDLGDGRLEISGKNISIKSSKNRAAVIFDMEISQKIGNVDVSYYRPKINLELEKIQVSHGFGLFDTDEWMMTRMESSVDLNLVVK